MGPLIGGGVASVLSLFVLSRAIADNPLYRFAQSVLIGAALGYASAVLLRSTVVPIVDALIFGQATTRQMIVGGLGLLLGLMLVPRFGRQRGSYWANLPIALLLGTGAALALAGAVRGTLVPQMLDTVRGTGLGPDLATQVGGAVLAVLAVTVLLSFTYTLPARGTPRLPARLFRGLGRGLILATFGVFFAATVSTYIAALVGQLGMISDWVTSLFTP